MGDMIKISRNEFASIDPVVPQRIRKFVAPHLSMSDVPGLVSALRRALSDDVPARMAPTYVSYDLTVGARYHGVALALQAERMGLTVTIDTRTKELCERTGVPHISAEELQGVVTRKTLFEEAEGLQRQEVRRVPQRAGWRLRRLPREQRAQPSEHLARLAGR